MTPRSRLTLDNECLPLMSPVWSSDITEGMIGSNLRAKAFVSILTSTGRSEIGRTDVQSRGSLPVLKIREREACVRVGGREPWRYE